MNNTKIAIIIGAGPAGLTAAYELLSRTDIKPILLEQSQDNGGISKTINYKGNRIDIGGHRFFSKSDRVMKWWLNIMPVENKEKPKAEESTIESNCDSEKIMLVRQRLSRIYFLRKFFPYPITLSIQTLLKLGIIRTIKISLSYAWIRIFPIKQEKSLEDFFINRFGRTLYETFFKNYTEKVWGISCSGINPEWGAQRIKGLSISKAIFQALRSLVFKTNDIAQKKTETSLIEQFLYPKYGPGQLWDIVANKILLMGGNIHYEWEVVEVNHDHDLISSIVARHTKSMEYRTFSGDYFFSTMPVKDLTKAMGNKVDENAKTIAAGLIYRDFITVGLLVKKLKIRNQTKIKTKHDLIPDNWIYIQEPDVKLGRLQVFNNWSPYMVQNENNVWLGLEYFCNEGDNLWNMDDKHFGDFAINELNSIGIIEKTDVLDHVVIRMPKTYPAYFGTYEQFPVLKDFFNRFENLFLVGRNGMHRYNNQDHSMLTAMTAVDNIIHQKKEKDNLWLINTEDDYHEEK